MIVAKERQTEAPISYPCLARNRLGGYVVLFTKRDTGTIVKGNSAAAIGYWQSHWDMYEFERFTGVLELSNEGVAA